MRRIRNPLVSLAIMLSVGGTCLQIGGCNLFGLATNAIASINPCGTILVCDPQQYEFLTSGIDSPGLRPSIDPFCTFPPFCTVAQDPLFGGLSPTGP